MAGRPAANPIQRAVQEIDLDIKRRERAIEKMRAARASLDEIMNDLQLNHAKRGRPRKRAQVSPIQVNGEIDGAAPKKRRKRARRG